MIEDGQGTSSPDQPRRAGGAGPARADAARADIVVGVDGSPGAEAALRWAVDEAARRGTRVRAVLGSCAGEQPSAVRRSAESVVGSHDDATLAQAAGQVLHRSLGAVRIPPGLDVIEEVVDAPGSEALLTTGRDAEMIVVGTRGRGLLHRLRIGSVSASVAVHSPVPVVVARTPRKGDADGEPSAQPAADDGSVRETPGASTRRPVVVGVDGSPNSLAALRWAADEAALRGAPLHVVHAWLAAVPLPFAETSSDILQTLEEQARVVLDDSIEEVLGTASGSTVPDERGGQPAEGGDPTGRARSAPPGASTIEIHRLLVAATATRALLEESREAELLVVGARGKGGFAELLLGSVSHQTMLHSAAPVAIVRDV